MKNEKNAQLDRYIKLMAGSQGKSFSPLSSLIGAGNIKIPSTTGIFNMGAATDCPSRRLGYCQATNKKGKNICYARKAEYDYHSTVLPYRRRQEKYWKSCTAEQFVVDFLTLNALKALPYTALRLNEAGDFWSQECVDKATHVARVLKKYGIRVYCYTSRQDLDFSRCSDYMTVSGSGFKKEGIRGIFTMVYSKKERPVGFGMCKGNCRICNRCLIGRKTAVLSH